MTHRLPALDWLRGIVMILMLTDHASGAFNSHRLVTDSVFFSSPDLVLPPLDFLYRWASHLCAPSFLFLAGVSLALSIERRRARGVTEARIDRELMTRGAIVMLVDLTIISWLWFPGSILLQVMYAIGGSMILMIPARRLPDPALLLVALAVIVGSELLLGPRLVVPAEPLPLARALLFGAGLVQAGAPTATLDPTQPPTAALLVGYPLLPWWAMMALGWALGRWILRKREIQAPLGRLAGPLAVGGALSLALFAVVRGLNAYGNMHLLREGPGWIQWLHLSKYPPSLSYVALELGLMSLLLAMLLVLQQRLGDRVSQNEPVLVFGQTAFFFYLAHILLLEAAARALGVHMALGLGASLAAGAVALLLLYPACRWYRSRKAAQPDSWMRYF